MTEAVSTLKNWSRDRKISTVSFDDDGMLQGEDSRKIRGEDTVQITVGDKVCQYAVASIFLQLIDPNQSLLEYRKVCRKHNVDPVKPIDKSTIIEFFLGSSPSSASALCDVAAAATKTESGPEATKNVSGAAQQRQSEGDIRDRDEIRDEKKRKYSSSGREENHRRHHSSKKRERDRERERSSSREPTSEKREKKIKTINPEMLFSNLTLVVGRREIKAKMDEVQPKLHRALCCDGFGVSAEIIAKFKKQDTMAHEIPLLNSSSILKAGAGKDLSRALKLYDETMEKKSSSRSSNGRANHSKSSSGTGSSSSNGNKTTWRSYLVGKKPIIVLPKGLTAPITLVNAHKFFAESKFVPRDKMQKELRIRKEQPKTQFSRNVNARLGGGKVEYELMDNPKLKLHKPQDWDRVVAVIALGQSWQMKDWPGSYSNPVKLFNRVFGFYVGMEGDNIPSELQGWSVTRSKLNRDKRGLDSVTFASFWNPLDEWMAIHKPEFLPQDLSR